MSILNIWSPIRGFSEEQRHTYTWPLCYHCIKHQDVKEFCFEVQDRLGEHVWIFEYSQNFGIYKCRLVTPPMTAYIFYGSYHCHMYGFQCHSLHPNPLQQLQMDVNDGEEKVLPTALDYWVSLFLTEDNHWHPQGDGDLDDQPAARLQYLSKIARALCRAKSIYDKHRLRAETGELNCSAKCHSRGVWLVFVWAQLARKFGIRDLQQLVPPNKLVSTEWESAISTELVERVTTLELTGKGLLEYSCGTSLTHSFCPSKPVVKEIYGALVEFNKNLMSLERLVKKVGDGTSMAMEHLQLLETVAKAFQYRTRCHELCLQLNTQAYFLRLHGQGLEGRKFGIRIQGFITNHTTQTLDEGLRDGFGQSLTEFLGHFGIVGLAGILKFKEGSAVNSKLQAKLEEHILLEPLPGEPVPRTSTPNLAGPSSSSGSTATLPTSEEQAKGGEPDEVETLSEGEATPEPQTPEPIQIPIPTRPNATSPNLVREVVEKNHPPPLETITLDEEPQRAGVSNPQTDKLQGKEAPTTAVVTNRLFASRVAVSTGLQTVTLNQMQEHTSMDQGATNYKEKLDQGQKAPDKEPPKERKEEVKKGGQKGVQIYRFKEDGEVFHDIDLFQGPRLGGRDYDEWLDTRKHHHLFGQWGGAGVFAHHPRLDWEKVEMKELGEGSGRYMTFSWGEKQVDARARQACLDRRQGVSYLVTPAELAINIQRFRDSPNKNDTGLAIAIGYWAYYLRQALEAYGEPIRCEICPPGGSSNFILYGLESLKAHLEDEHKLNYRGCVEASHADYRKRQSCHFPPERIKFWDQEAKEIGKRLASRYGEKVQDRSRKASTQLSPGSKRKELNGFKNSRPEKSGHNSNPNSGLGNNHSTAHRSLRTGRIYPESSLTRSRKEAPEKQEKMGEDSSSPSKQRKKNHDSSVTSSARTQKALKEKEGIFEPVGAETGRSEGSESGVMSLDSFHNEESGSGLTIEVPGGENQEEPLPHLSLREVSAFLEEH